MDEPEDDVRIKLSLVSHDDDINIVKLCDKWTVLEAIVYICIKMVSYGFMLVAMTFNFWVVLTICLGLALSEFIVNVIKDRIFVKRYIQYIAYKEIKDA